VNDLKKYLQGGDLRSIAGVDQLMPLIKTQKKFDELFTWLHSQDRLIVMRAADAIEKVTRTQPAYLDPHQTEIIELLKTAKDKELRWHAAQLAPRIDLSWNKVEQVWNKLEDWARDRSESKIVRVNALQALFELSGKYVELKKDFEQIAREVKAEGIPSINARLSKLLGE
jgi:hypothetical protein